MDYLLGVLSLLQNKCALNYKKEIVNSLKTNQTWKYKYSKKEPITFWKVTAKY